MYLITEWRLNLKTVSEANASGHWMKAYARKKLQRHVISIAWLKDTPMVGFPCKVKLTRVSTRMLDVGDNLPMAFKAIRDAIADKLMPGRPPGFADSSPLITWEYDQKKGRPAGIIVQFWSVDTELSPNAQLMIAKRENFI